MRVVRIYQDQALSPGSDCQLDPQASCHVAQVLRMGIGQTLVLFNGTGKEYAAVIVQVGKKQVQVRIETEQSVERESSLKLHLAQGLAKGEKMDWIMQKAVELGVNAITPLLTERSCLKLDAARLNKKLEHWRKVIISAGEQSGRTVLPTLNPPQTMAAFLASQSAALKLILQPEGQNKLRELAPVQQTVCVLIGPEGGFSPAELDLAAQADCLSLNLGQRILRTETAAVAALAILQAQWGDG